MFSNCNNKVLFKEHLFFLNWGQSLSQVCSQSPSSEKPSRVQILNTLIQPYSYSVKLKASSNCQQLCIFPSLLCSRLFNSSQLVWRTVSCGRGMQNTLGDYPPKPYMDFWNQFVHRRPEFWKTILTPTQTYSSLWLEPLFTS